MQNFKLLTWSETPKTGFLKSSIFAEIPEDAIDESDNEDNHEDTNKHRDRRVSSTPK